MGQFVVIGLGDFGSNVATTLSELGNHVLVIDSDSKKNAQIKGKVTRTAVADVTDKKALSGFVNNNIDAAIVALGNEMEASTLATLYLKNLGVKKIIVKAMNDHHAQVSKSIGATEIIYPEKEIATILAQRLTTSN